MDKENRDELEIKIKRILPRVDMDKKMKDNMNNYYLEKNINPSVPARIINTGAIGLLQPVQLCMFVKSINMTPNKFHLDENKYFTKDEIKLADAYKESKIDKKDDVIVFKNVDRSRDNLWICTKITFDELQDLANKGIIGYNFKTQRDARIIYKGKDMIKMPFVNKEAIEEMKESWKLGVFTPNMITFNLEHTYKENPPEYDKINRTLKITLNEGESLNVADGYHRTLTAIYIKEEDPNFSTGFYYLRILNFTEEEAHNFILQESKGTPISEQQMKYMNEQDMNMIIAKDISSFGNTRTNIMFNKLTVSKKEITHGDKYCFYNTVADAIGHYFDTSDKLNNARIEKVLLEGLDTIIRLNEVDFKNYKKSRENSVVTYNNTFALYIAILGRLYDFNYDVEVKLEDKGRFKNKILDVLSKIDFSKNSSLWKDLNIMTKTKAMTIQELNLIDYNKIEDYVVGLIPDSEKIMVEEM